MVTIDTKEKILVGTDRLFMKLGFKTVTMDDVCRELGISKKTLYQYFTDKTDLVKQTITEIFKHQDCQIVSIHAEIKNPIDEALQIMKAVSKMMKEVNPTAIHDLKKYYPECWEMFKLRKQNIILPTISSNFERGIEQGLYRSDLHINILSKIYAEIIDLLVSDHIFPAHEYSFQEVYHTFMNYHLRGIVTPKGLKYLEKRINEILTNK
jgi:AcrR family transcriptional regulator